MSAAAVAAYLAVTEAATRTRLTLGSWGRILAIVFPLAGLAIGFVPLGPGHEREGRRILLLAAVMALVHFFVLIETHFIPR